MLIKIPSLKGFIVESVSKIRLVFLGRSPCDKFRIFLWSLLSSTPNIMKNHFPVVNNEKLSFEKRLGMQMVAKSQDITYTFLDIDSLLTLSQGYEKFMEPWFKPIAGDVVIDIGANIGRYTLIMARKVGNEGIIVAVEPHPTNYCVLKKNIRLNALRNVVALNLAAWFTGSALTLFEGKTTGLHSVKTDMGRGGNKVRVEAVDAIVRELRLKRVDWIKIDVEGAEWEVLCGLLKTLDQHKPKLIIEIFHENQRKIKKLMKSHGYDLIKISPKFSQNTYFFGVSNGSAYTDIETPRLDTVLITPMLQEPNA